ncbi:ArnT family glycosyltransferase [Amycolatopsis taiwanensis]|uniref:Glycosyltransferase RgtA/B/C/D-like domain-containing protein n=1 Tax=Amycolatopsis taiwanensis TaxID=342230 RepID=A0A9W6VI64_9PSEU|nr:glycosyltransferase family 39 protein [Amycolatopsis taiwanensis]GLY67176.1 hypothetical protein Atai01_37950 [Amycolatopsis taiwanensis]
MGGSATALRVENITSLPRFALRPVGAVVLVQAIMLTALSGRYGFHRDEMYFVASGDHLAWGYVDNPPITPFLAKAATFFFGDTPMGLRVVATLAGVLTVIAAALIARELGGGAAAQALAGAATALSTEVLALSHMVSTTSVDTVMWVVLGLLTVRLLRTGDGRWWVAIGAAAGVGMANKWLVLLLVAAIGVGLLATGPRAVLRSGWLALGVLVALVLVAPLIVWQATHGFPMLTVAGGISDKDGTENRIMFVPMQVVYLSPVLVPVWLAGLVRLWRDRRYRALAVSYPLICAILLVMGGKPYYSVPLLVVLMAAGAEPAVRWLRTRARRVAAAVAGVVAVVISVLVALPVLPPSALGPVLAVNKEQGEQVGWPELVTTISGVWQQLPAEQRETAVIFTGNYGQASAINVYGADAGLPGAYSGHMSYADWGPPPDAMTGPVVLVGPHGGGPFVGCRQAAVNDNGAGVDNEEQGTWISLCDGTTGPWSQIWPQLRHYY